MIHCPDHRAGPVGPLVINNFAAEFLDRVYTNLMSSLKVGSIRYGLMCRADGMVFDDGTVHRLAEDRFFVTTTTGNASAVLDWLERTGLP